MNISIIIPVYNEEEIIGKLLDAVSQETENISAHKVQLLIVDGQSTDETRQRVEEKVRTNPKIHLIVEPEKHGLGSAYVFGMNWAIDHLQADAFMEFDGDFQHDPHDIPKLIAKLDQGYDYIIGSRYIPGGTIPATWPWYRKFLSSMGNLIIKIGLGVPTHDNTSGFKLTRVAGFKNILPLGTNEVISHRHAYKIHFLYAMTTAHARTIEVPIHFLSRNKGVSKSTIEDIIESLKVVWVLRLRRLRDRSLNKNKTGVNKKT